MSIPANIPRSLACVLAAAVLSLCPGIGVAQYQLGDGRGLDNNLQRGSGGVNAPKLRNTQGLYSDAVVTGNVTGLARFRGDISYPASSEFRGQLGSDDLFDFNRRAYQPTDGVRRLYGGLPSNNALRPDLASGTGSQILLRSGAGATTGGVTGQYQPYGPDVDVRRNDLGAIQQFRIEQQRLNRPRLGYGEAASYSRHVLAVQQDQAGRRLQVETSPLRGLVMARYGFEGEAQPADGTEADADPTQRADGAQRLGGTQAIAGRPAPGAEGDAETLTRAQQRREQLRRSTAQYLEPRRLALADRLGAGLVGGQRLEPGATGEVPLDRAVDRVLTLRPEGQGEAGQARGDEAEAPTDPYERLLWEIRERYALPDDQGQRDDQGEAGDGEPAEGEDDPAADDAGAAGADVLDRAVGKLDYDLPARKTLAGADDENLKRAMGKAEQKLAEGSYFAAADAYEEALVYQPGYPPARIGRAHAYLGAGMFGSAARVLRSTLRDHPELIAARYDQPLLPDDKRLAQLRKSLDDRAGAFEKDTAAPFLLAYLAYQQGEGESVAKHLSNLNQRADNDTLLPLLRRIWTGPQAPAKQESQD